MQAMHHMINILSKLKNYLTRCLAEVEVFLNEQFIRYYSSGSGITMVVVVGYLFLW